MLLLNTDQETTLLIFIYNILQFVILALFWPLLLLGIATREKYRGGFTARMGLRLSRELPPPDSHNLNFWIHALSVGEVTSAVPLISGIRDTWPDSRIVVTVTTTSGMQTAKNLLQDKADFILSSPLDIRPVVAGFIRKIDPDIYIHVETDFWPNQLQLLHKAHIPTILVNGRISESSFQSYRKFSFFFKPMFRCFNHLCMQTEKDRAAMESLGIPREALHTLGNLKFDTLIPGTSIDIDYTALLPQDALVFTAGSTHPGEEEILLSVYARIRHRFPHIYMVIVPRDPARGEEIRKIAKNRQLHAVLRSQLTGDHGNLLIVDTLGELINFYRYSGIAFVGGSLVPEGGHNPIEPAIFSIPVIYGKHMEDFYEIAEDLEQCGGGTTAFDADQLESILVRLSEQPEQRQQMGEAAVNCIENKKGVIKKHLSLINSLL